MAGDPYYDNVALLLHCDGADGGATFTDVKGSTITVIGGAVTSTAKKKFGTASLRLPATSACLSIPAPAASIGSGDFCLELHLSRETNNAIAGVFVMGSDGGKLMLNLDCPGGGTPAHVRAYIGADLVGYADSAILYNSASLSHIALSRSGGTVKLFVDGVLSDTRTSTTSIPSAASTIGYDGYSGMVGNIDEFRLTVGAARYTESFLPPTEAYPEYQEILPAEAVASVPSPLAQVSAVVGLSTASLASIPSPLSAPVVTASTNICAVPGSDIFRAGQPSAKVRVIAMGVDVSVGYGSIAAIYDRPADVVGAGPLTRGGTPLSWQITVITPATIHDAYGSCSTSYGQVASASPVSADAAGASETQYGYISSAPVCGVAGAALTQVGALSTKLTAMVSGAQGTKYGVPFLFTPHLSVGVSRTRYGRVTSGNPDACRVYGLNNGRRAGTPRAVEIA